MLESKGVHLYILSSLWCAAWWQSGRSHSYKSNWSRDVEVHCVGCQQLVSFHFLDSYLTLYFNWLTKLVVTMNHQSWPAEIATYTYVTPSKCCGWQTIHAHRLDSMHCYLKRKRLPINPYLKLSILHHNFLCVGKDAVSLLYCSNNER